MSGVPKDFQFRVPWHATDDQRLQDELRRELSPQHQLYGKETRVIARRQDCDDVLFELLEGNLPAAYVVVHLTWSGHPDQYPLQFPGTVFYSTFADWVDRDMTLEAESWQ